MKKVPHGVPIAVVEQETGLSKDVLRKWETRYNYPVPDRDAHGDRIYSREQVKRLRTIKRLMDHGFRPSRLFRMSETELSELANSSQFTASDYDDATAVPELLAFIRKHQPMKLRAALKRLLRVSERLMQLARAEGARLRRDSAADLCPVVRILVEEQGRVGRKAGKGFYDYDGKKKQLWPGLAEIAPSKPAENFDIEELKQRLLVAQALETARIFEEGILTDVREADVGSILGFGFAPWAGGTLSYIDMMGTDKFVKAAKKFQKKYGERFKPNALLVDMAAKGEGFYMRFNPQKPRKKAA